MGRAIGEVRRYTTGFQNEMRDALGDPAPSTRPPPATAGETPAPAGETPAPAGQTGSTPSPAEQTTVVSESIDIVPAREQETVRDEVSPITDNGDTPSA